VGHALEAVTKYRRFRHGEAVAYGMLAAAAISVSRGLMPADDQAALADVVRRLGPLPAVSDLKIDDLIESTSRDKKRVAGTLHFVLCTGIGKTQIVSDVTPAELRTALAAIGAGA
jgi:3-dehydroquinate synthase